MSHNRNTKYLDNKRIVYRRDPIEDIPTQENECYLFYEDGTYECYHLFNSKAKITTYKSLKWHMLVLYYLNIDNDIEDQFYTIFRFIADKENGFVTFFIKTKILNNMIQDVFDQGGDAPANKMRKVIFKPYSGLDLSGKLTIVGKLIGRKRITEDQIYLMMLDINDSGAKISIQYLANLLSCSKRTIYRNISNQLKNEIKILNEEI